MPAQTLPNLGLVAGWDLGETPFNEGLDANLYKLDSLVHLQVLSASTAAPPAAVEGDRYIIPTAGTGLWATHDGKIAVYDAGWIFFDPIDGIVAFVDDTKSTVIYDGAWLPHPGSRAAGLVINFTANANWVLVEAEYAYELLVITDTGVLLTQQRDVSLPDVTWGRWIVDNQTAQSLQVRRASDGSGVIVAAGTRAAIVVMNGVLA